MDFSLLVVISESIKYRFGLRGAFAIFKHPTPKIPSSKSRRVFWWRRGLKHANALSTQKRIFDRLRYYYWQGGSIENNRNQGYINKNGARKKQLRVVNVKSERKLRKEVCRGVMREAQLSTKDSKKKCQAHVAVVRQA